MHMRTILALGVATTVVCVGTVVAVQVTTAGRADAATWSTYQLDGDSCVDAWSADPDGNGYPNVIWFDLTGNCAPDTWVLDPDEPNGIVESYGYDLSENGYPEVWVEQRLTELGQQMDVCHDYADDGFAGSSDICYGSVVATVGPPDWSAGPNALLLQLAAMYGVVIL